MKILYQYTKRIMLANKGRTAVTIIGITLTFALLTAVLTTASSALDFLVRFVIDDTGDYYGAVYDCSSEEISHFGEYEEIDSYVSMNIEGFAREEDAAQFNSQKPYIFVGGVDEQFCEAMSIHVTEGRLPQGADEILVPNHILSRCYFCELGDTITLSLGERYTLDGVKLDRNTPLQWTQADAYSPVQGLEEIRGAKERRFTVVGFYERPGLESYITPCYTFLTSSSGTGEGEVYFKTKEIEEAQSFLSAYFSGRPCGANETLLRYMGKGNADIRDMMYGMCSVLAAVISAAGLALIYNSFSISLGERTKQFGLFKSMGATRFQIRMSVFIEAGILCLIAIPLGLIVGCLGVVVVLGLLQSSFKDMMGVYNTGTQMSFHTEPLYLLAAVAVGIATVFLSAVIPAARANRITPIEGIRQVTDIRDTMKKPGRYSGKGLAGRILGIGGLLAHRNARRNKKPYRAICLSLATSLLLFLGGGGFVYYLQQSISILNEQYQYDYRVLEMLDSYEDTAAIGLLDEGLRQEESVEDYALLLTGSITLDVPEELLTKTGQKYREVDGSALLYAVNDRAYRTYVESLGLSAEEYLSPEHPKALLLNGIRGEMPAEDGGRRFYEGSFLTEDAELSSVRLSVLSLEEGAEDSTWYTNEQGQIVYYTGHTEDGYIEEHAVSLEEAMRSLEIELGACVESEDYPYWVSSGPPIVVVPMSILEQEVFPKMASIDNQVTADIVSSDMEATENFLNAFQREHAQNRLSVSNVTETMAMQRGLFHVVNVLLMCFIVLICLIALSNMANTIATSVRLRTREYAMMKAIGISRSTFLKFIAAENTGYAIKGCVLGVILGLAANYLTYLSLKESFYGIFFIPVLYYVIGSVSIVGVVVLASAYTWHKVKKGNICEELRKEAL